MSLAGLVILSSSRKPIISSPFRPPSRQHVLTTAFLTALADKDRELPPFLFIGEDEGVCCSLEHSGLWFLVGIESEGNCLAAYRFLEIFLRALELYLGEVSESSIKEHFDTVYQLLEEMLDEGTPLTTEPNILRDIVLPPTLLTKVLSATGMTGLGPPSTTQPFSSPIPWRRAGVKHSSSEVFFDFIEGIDVVLDRKGKSIKTSRYGRIECNARLSGTPDLLLTFQDPSPIITPAFHPCIRLARYESSRALSFIPPDGGFRLMEYIIASPPTTRAGGSQMSRGDGGSEDAGVKIKVKVIQAENGGTFSIAVASTHHYRPVEDAVVRWHLGADVVAERLTGTLTPGGGATDAEGSGAGSWEFDGSSESLIWRLPTLAPRSTSRTFTGSFTTSSPPNPSPAVCLTYKIHQHSLSGLRVGQLKVSGANDGRGPNQAHGGGKGGGAEGGKVFRGMRGRVEGKIEARW